MSGLNFAADDYLPFDNSRKYIIIDKYNEHFGEVVRLYNDEENVLFYDFEAGWYLFDTLDFIGIHSRTQLARFSAITKEMIYGTIAVANTAFKDEELVKLIPCPVDTSIFNFPKQMMEEMEKRTFDYSPLSNLDSHGSTTQFLDFDIVKLGQTREEIETYLEKHNDYILYLKDRTKVEEIKEDKDEKIKRLEKELAEANAELEEFRAKLLDKTELDDFYDDEVE